MDRKIRVLVIEDDGDTASRMQRLLEAAEFRSAEPVDSTYQEAVKRWQEFLNTLAGSISDRSPTPPTSELSTHVSILGGPGQGKSTLHYVMADSVIGMPEETPPIDIRMKQHPNIELLKEAASSRPKKARRTRYVAAQERQTGSYNRKTKITSPSDIDIILKVFFDDAWSTLWEGTRQVWLDHFADEPDTPARSIVVNFVAHGLHTLKEAAEVASQSAFQAYYLRYKRAIDELDEQWDVAPVCRADGKKGGKHTYLDAYTLVSWMGADPSGCQAVEHYKPCVYLVSKPSSSSNKGQRQGNSNDTFGTIIVLNSCLSGTQPPIPHCRSFNGHEAVPAGLRPLGITNAVYKEADHFVDMDGYLVVDKKKAILTLRAGLTDAEKWRGLANIVEQLRAAQKASDAPITDVFVWKNTADTDSIEGDVIEVEQ